MLTIISHYVTCNKTVPCEISLAHWSPCIKVQAENFHALSNAAGTLLAYIYHWRRWSYWDLLSLAFVLLQSFMTWCAHCLQSFVFKFPNTYMPFSLLCSIHSIDLSFPCIQSECGSSILNIEHSFLCHMQHSRANSARSVMFSFTSWALWFSLDRAFLNYVLRSVVLVFVVF